MKKKKTALALTAFCVFISCLDIVQGQEPLVIPFLSQAPKIDGRLDDKVWQEEALRIEDFLQFAPVEGARPEDAIKAYLGYDHRNFYLAFRCNDRQASRIRASITRRDNNIEDDWMLVMLDTYNEKRRAFSFFINPLGIQMDAIRIEEGGGDSFDMSWDAVFSSEGQIDERGYSIEMAIPFKSIRFPDQQRKVWRLMLVRNLARTGEINVWPEAKKSIPGLITQSREIVLEKDIDRGGNLELMPVSTLLKTESEKIDFQPGLNFKWGISSNLTLDATINPDFSHIEADAPQIDINQRFALYYEEKRPFFLEGMELFRFPAFNLVYTRRINQPLGGLRLTGKTGRFAFSLLSSYDTNPLENLWQIGNGQGSTSQNAFFNIIRVKADTWKESYLGLTLTDKEINGSWNRVIGLDGQVKFAGNFFFVFQSALTGNGGDDRESTAAPGLYSEFFYQGKCYSGGFYWQSLHPEFDAGSGFVNRTDYKTLGLFSSLRFYPEKKYLNQFRIGLSAGNRYEYFGDNLTDRWFRSNLQLRLTEFNQVYFNLHSELEEFAGREFSKLYFSVGSDFQYIGWLPFGFYFRSGDAVYYDPDDPLAGRRNDFQLYFTLKPNKRLQLGLQFQKQAFWDGESKERLYDYNVARLSTTYQLSREISLRAIADYNHYQRRVYGSLLFSYVPHPGTVFFLGFDQRMQRDEFGKYDRQSYSVFAKFSYWWRI